MIPAMVERSMATHRFSAMGTSGEVTVVGGDPALGASIETRIAQLEARWSRFLPDSDISALNRHSGSWVRVAPETITLLERSVAAARATDGRFDPTTGAALIAHGYDRTFTAVAGHARSLDPAPIVDAAWPAIEVDPGSASARLPEATTFDAGGIGKGLAVDLVIAEFAHRVDGLLVNLGGDLRATGMAPDPAGWIVAIEDPFEPATPRGRLAIEAGAVATSSHGTAHHIIDPSTGRPARTMVAAATVVAAEAWWAEAHATSLLIEGPAGLDHLDESVHAILVLTDGTEVASPALHGVLR
jgi:thiamine biosynthesis lipoprotein